jgi:hypothetical protein
VGTFFETPHDNRPDFVLSIAAYLDETQHTATTEHVVVAGFFGTNEEWDKFIELWKVALGKRKMLHMNTLRWNTKKSKRRVKELLARLGPLPHRAGLCPVYGAVKVGDYADLIANAPRYENKVVLCGYILCLSIVLSRLNYSLPPHAVIKVVCERQGEYASRVKELFDATSKRHARDPQNPYLASIEFMGKGASVATQPADFLAFAVGKYLDESGSKKDMWCRSIFGTLAPERIGYVPNREKTRKLIQHIVRGSAIAMARGIYI